MPTTTQGTSRGNRQGKQVVPRDQPPKDERRNQSNSQPTPDEDFRILDKYKAKQMDAWALLEAKGKGPLRNLKIRMTYPPDLVASVSNQSSSGHYGELERLRGKAGSL